MTHTCCARRCWTRTACSRSESCTPPAASRCRARWSRWWGPPAQAGTRILLQSWQLQRLSRQHFLCCAGDLLPREVGAHAETFTAAQANPRCWTSWRCARAASCPGRCGTCSMQLLMLCCCLMQPHAAAMAGTTGACAAPCMQVWMNGAPLGALFKRSNTYVAQARPSCLPRFTPFPHLLATLPTARHSSTAQQSSARAWRGAACPACMHAGGRVRADAERMGDAALPRHPAHARGRAARGGPAPHGGHARRHGPLALRAHAGMPETGTPKQGVLLTSTCLRPGPAPPFAAEASSALYRRSCCLRRPLRPASHSWQKHPVHPADAPVATERRWAACWQAASSSEA